MITSLLTGVLLGLCCGVPALIVLGIYFGSRPIRTVRMCGKCNTVLQDDEPKCPNCKD